jgi:hypothetical protein
MKRKTALMPRADGRQDLAMQHDVFELRVADFRRRIHCYFAAV